MAIKKIFKRGMVVFHKADGRRLVVLGDDTTMPDTKKVLCRYAVGDVYKIRSFFVEELTAKD